MILVKWTRINEQQGNTSGEYRFFSIGKKKSDRMLPEVWFSFTFDKPAKLGGESMKKSTYFNFQIKKERSFNLRSLNFFSINASKTFLSVCAEREEIGVCM